MSTGPNNDLGLTAKSVAGAGAGCCGGDGGSGCGSTNGCGGACGSEPSGGCGSGGGCACQAAPAPTVRTDSVIGAPRVSSAPQASSSVFEVTGMTRARCIVTVMNALERLPGVESVDVDLNSGGVSRVTVASSWELDRDAVHAALVDCGYALATNAVPFAS